ncbi:MAG: hypothetical protein AAF318_13760 [Pseudomonadota bacterium]
MSDNNLVPVPEAEDRRAALRRARRERRLAKAERAEAEAPQKPKMGEAKVARVQKAKRADPVPSAAIITPETFVLPGKPTVEKERSTFGQFVRLMFVVFVLLPTLAAVVFYGFFASDQYATQSSFAVRGASDSSSIDVGGLLSAAGAGADTETADSYILQEYIQSREVVDILVREANFVAIYSRPEADPYYRLDPNGSIEDFVSYWQMMSAVEFDTDTGIISLIIRAFRPEDAQTITAKVVETSEALVNELSLRAREDGVKTARNEVQVAEERFAESRKSLASYRGTEQEIDPTASATSQQTIVATLEGELATRQSELRALRATMSENAPRVVYVQNQINALQRQIAAERLSVAVAEDGNQRPVLTERLSRYEELLAEREFAEKAYISSLASLETARIEALKQQRYLAVFVNGRAPQDATYPEAIRWTLMLFGTLLAIWGACALIAAAIRDRIV